MPSTSSSEPMETADYQTYRTTCDNCARSKVRCTKETQCKRCVSHGAVCIYSPSRRLKRSMGDDNVHALPWALFQYPSLDSNERRTSEALDHDAISRTTSDVSPSSDLQSMLVDWENTAPWATFPGNDSSLGSSSASSGMAMDPCLIISHMDDVLVTSEEATGLKSPMNMVTQDDIGTGCARIGAALLTCLESPGAPMVMTTHVAPDMPSKRLRRDVGAMVRINREALDQVQLVLECPCGAPSNHIPIVTVVLSMILSWYEACLQSVNANDGQPECGSKLDVLPSSSTRCSISGDSKLAALEEEAHCHVDSDTAGQSRDDLVCVPPIQIGGLRLDARHAGQVVAQIITDDLKEVGRMIDRLTLHSGSTTVRQEWEAQLQLSLAAALRARVKKVLQTAGCKNGDDV